MDFHDGSTQYPPVGDLELIGSRTVQNPLGFEVQRRKRNLKYGTPAIFLTETAIESASFMF